MLTLTVALDSGLVYVGGLRRSDDQEVLLRNGDVIPASIEFRTSINSATTVDMGSSASLRLTVKPKGLFDANALLSFGSWTRTVTGSAIDYRATINTASGGIDRLLGIDPYDVAEKVAIQTTASTAAGAYFDLADASGPVRVWMGLSGTTAPEVPGGGRLLKVLMVGGENAAAIAAKIATAIDNDSAFIASSISDVVTVTSAEIGQRQAPHPRSSGYGITVLEAGGDETVVDVPSVVLQAEITWLYSGNLTTSRALRWKVENTNRRASQAVSLPPMGGGGGGSFSGQFYLSQFQGNGIVSSFSPISGFAGSTAAKDYEVTVGGVLQEPDFSYDITSANGGTVVFPSVIPNGRRIFVRLLK